MFGSRAMGRARPFSDLDLLLTTPERLSWQQRCELADRFEQSPCPFGWTWWKPPAWHRACRRVC
ncbi:nucleotidyltransferase domain-containing protein [Aquabacterium sp. A08]|nr:nucleotidyltransferase domain-containing protein [Aquabacterium sp. A08]